MGKRAVEILIKERDPYFAGKKTTYIQEELPVRFVAGETTAPAKV
jgi:DNA-binding LacI/PurR family transcriptional regulator